MTEIGLPDVQAREGGGTPSQARITKTSHQREVKSVRQNIFHLFLWQGSNYLVPVLVTPYLTRSFGLSSYGVFGFSIAVSAYVVLLTDWGFGLSATQKVARASDDPDRLRDLFWSVLSAKIMLGLLALAALFVATLAVPELRAIWPMLLAASLAAVSTALSASFFLQGLQDMSAFTTSALVGKLLIVPLMLLFVHRPADMFVALLIQNGTQLVSAIASIVISARRVPLLPARFDAAGGWIEIKDGWHQFLSMFSVSLYTQANTIVVGLTAGAVQAGLLTSSQRISQAFQGLVIPVNLAVYPQVSRLSHSDPPSAVRLMARVVAGQALFSSLLSIIMFVVARLIVPVFLGKAFEPSLPVVQVLSALPFLVGITNVLGTNILLPLGLKGSYTASLAIAGAVNLVALLVLTPRLGALGGALSAVITETLLCLMMGGTICFQRAIFARMRVGEPP